MRNELITFTDPKSPTSEMFKTLRTNLQFMGNSKKIQTILITSTLPGEGKSWTSANLAVTFAQAGKKVVLVDADMRKGRQFAVFNVVARPGLSNFLSSVVNDGEVRNVDDVTCFVKETGIENLYVIPAGDVPPNPSELLVNSRMGYLLNDLKSNFDIIIFDAPPALLVTDAIILSKIVDTTMIVVAHQETKMENLDKVQKSIKNVGGNLAGVVINKIPAAVKKYQDSYYGSYYGDTIDIEKSRKAKVNPSLYLRGKATILEDRDKQRNNNINRADSNTENKQTLNGRVVEMPQKPLENNSNAFQNVETKEVASGVYQNIDANKKISTPTFNSTEPKKESVLNYRFQTTQPKVEPTTNTSFNNSVGQEKSVTNGVYQNINLDKEVPSQAQNKAQAENASSISKTEEMIRKMNEQLQAEMKKMNNQ